MKKMFLFLLIFLLIILGCKKEKENRPPVINSITASSQVFYPESTYTFECSAYDLDGDYLTYHWSCTNGTLLSSSGKTVNWKAPERSGTAIISCEVRDGKGGRDKMDKGVTIKPITITIINWSGYIEAGYAYHWERYIKKDWTIHGYFSVAGGEGIKFRILDATNFEKWRNGYEYKALVSTGWSSGTTFSAVIPASGYYYVILENWYTIYDKYVTLFVQITSP